MAEPELQQPQPQKVEIPPVIEEQTRGGKQYRAFQKQNPNATTWESHVGSLLGSFSWISMAAAGALGPQGAIGSVIAGLGVGTVGMFIAPIAIGMGLTYAGSFLGQRVGKSRVEKENKEGKVYTQPTALNHDTVEQGLSGAFVWKVITALGLGAGLFGMKYLGVDVGSLLGTDNATLTLGTSLAAAAYGGIKGTFSGMSTGKARMEREYQDAELINALQTGKGVPVRGIANDIEGQAKGKTAGLLAGVTTTVDPSTMIHSIPGIMGEKMPDGTNGKVGGNKQYQDFSYLGDAHPAFAKKINFAQREMDKAALKEQQLAPQR